MNLPDRLQNRYRVVRLVASGGMGAVYEAVDERFDKRVAVKKAILGDDEGTCDELARAFAREAKLLNTLRHQSLPVVTDYFTEGRAHYLVMDFVEGQDLGERVASSGPLPIREALAVANALLDTLTYLHTRVPPVIHRDIKPQNVKITPDGRIVLLDFGLSKGVLSQITGGMSRSLFGYSKHYAPYEQIQGEVTDERSDLYSLAATLYFLVTGQKPMDAGVRVTAVIEGRPDPLPPAHRVNELVSRALSDVLSQALALNRERRPADARAFRYALHNVQPSQDSADTDETTIVRRRKEAHPALEHGESNMSDNPNAPQSTVTVTAKMPDRTLRTYELAAEAIPDFALAPRSGSMEVWCRATIERLPAGSVVREVFTDLYRQLVIGNYATVDGLSGHRATPVLDRLYPDRGTLPSFERKPKPNASGLILYNLVKHADTGGRGYRVLASMLARMLEDGYLKTPDPKVSL